MSTPPIRERFKVVHNIWKEEHHGTLVWQEYLSFVRDIFKLDRETQDEIMLSVLTAIVPSEGNVDGITIAMTVIANWFMQNDNYKCCVCKQMFVGMGNNPYPLYRTVGDRCCDSCNYNHVLPARLQRLAQKSDKEEEEESGFCCGNDAKGKTCDCTTG